MEKAAPCGCRLFLFRKLSPNYVVWMLLTKQRFAVFHKIDVLDSGLDYLVPARFTAPPQTPYVHVCPFRKKVRFLHIPDCRLFRMIIRMASLAELIALSTSTSLPYPFTSMPRMVRATVGAASYDLTILNDDCSRWESFIKRVFSCKCLCKQNKSIVFWNIAQCPVQWKIRILHVLHTESISVSMKSKSTPKPVIIHPQIPYL